MDYGSIIYGSARKSYLKDLDTIHHQGLRLCLGAFKTSPIDSLYVEANEPSLHLRRKKLSLQYATKLFANPSNPAFDCVFHACYQDLYNKKVTAIPPFGIRIKPYIEECGINFNIIQNQTLTDDPPWLLDKPEVNLDLAKFKKSETSEQVYQQEFAIIKDNYARLIPSILRDELRHLDLIYTDGSKDGGRVSSAAIIEDEITSVRLPKESSIFTAEAKAILLALQYISKSPHINFIICSDSLSVLRAIKSGKLDHPLIQEILELHTSITYAISDFQKTINYCWLPGHVGIKGNEKADSAAKAALSKPITRSFIPYRDIRPLICNYINNQWSDHWNSQEQNKLYSVQPCLGFTLLSQYSRRESIVLRP